MDIDILAIALDNTVESIERLIRKEDQALTVDEAALLMNCTPAAFYRKNIRPDWKVGRVMRFSLAGLAHTKTTA